MITIAVPLVVCVIGLLIYFTTDKPKVAEVSLWAYKVGLVFTLWAIGYLGAQIVNTLSK